jgi:hypothetical protein
MGMCIQAITSNNQVVIEPCAMRSSSWPDTNNPNAASNHQLAYPQYWSVDTAGQIQLLNQSNPPTVNNQVCSFGRCWYTQTCLDIVNNRPDQNVGANIDIAQCNNSAGQVWKYQSDVVKNGHTVFGAIVAVNHDPDPNTHQSYCLNLYNNNPSAGTRIDVEPCNGGYAQTFLPALFGVSIFSVANSGNCIDLDNNNLLATEPCNPYNVISQEWNFIPAQVDGIYPPNGGTCEGTACAGVPYYHAHMVTQSCDDSTQCVGSPGGQTGHDAVAQWNGYYPSGGCPWNTGPNTIGITYSNQGDNMGPDPNCAGGAGLYDVWAYSSSGFFTSQGWTDRTSPYFCMDGTGATGNELKLDQNLGCDFANNWGLSLLGLY